MKLPFGKFKGQELAQVDPGYLRWVLTTDNRWVTAHRAEIQQVLQDHLQSRWSALPEVSVTPHQAERVTEILQWIHQGEPVVRLEGGAGYGKSYAVKKLLRDLKRPAVACATSYVATQVLAKDLEPLGFQTKTIAKTLKMAKVFNDGVEEYVLTADSTEAARALLSRGNVLVVDECSMVNDEIARLLLDSAQEAGGTLVLVGDRFQLPPVKQETISLLCLTEHAATLTEPMRYSRDSDLFRVEQTARMRPHAIMDRLSDSDQVTLAGTHDALIRDYVTRYQADPTANHRMLLFRRTDVVEANTRIRAHLYGAQAPLVADGEKLMVLRTTDTPWRGPNPLQGETTRYYSGESFYVTESHESTYQFLLNDAVYNIPHYLVRFQDRTESVRIVFGITENTTDTNTLGGPEFQAAINAAGAYGRETGDWLPWRTLQSDFVAVAYQYATSVHRAQGQTADYAYVTPKTLLSVRGIMGPALTYVALTRARKHLTVLAC